MAENRETALAVLRDVAENSSDDEHRLAAAQCLLHAEIDYNAFPSPADLADQIADRILTRLDDRSWTQPPPIE